MSLGIFTPVLLFRTADVGSYNLGVGHMQLFMWMLNALAGDLKEYIDKYVVGRLKDFNFGPNAEVAKWQFRKMGKENTETVRAVLTELVRVGRAKPDLDELGMLAGMTIDEIKIVTTPPPDPAADPNADPPVDPDKREVRDKPKTTKPKGVGQPRATGKQIAARISGQVEKAWRERTFGKGFSPSLGYRRRFEEALKAEGADDGTALSMAESMYGRVENWMRDVIGLGMNEFAGPEDFMALFNRMLETEIDALEEAV
jgi:hypothetical protein